MKPVVVPVLVLYLLTTGVFKVRADEQLATNPESNLEIQEKTTGKLFNPSVIFAFDFSGVYRTIDNDEYDALAVPGFYKVGFDDHDVCFFNSNRGFNLNYGELSLFAPVDRVFELTAVFHATERKAELEEAFFKSGFLPWGFYLQVGKFMSGFGRLNSQRHYEWPFAEQPLIYGQFLGSHGLNEKGARLAWSRKALLNYHIGGEILYGDNQRSFGTEGFSINGHDIDDSNGVPLHCGFAKVSLERGPYLLSCGGSVVLGYSRIDQGLDPSTPGSGFADYTHAVLYNAELFFKYNYSENRSLVIQSEFMYKTAEGYRYFSSGEKAGLDIAQSGLYIDVFIALTSKINAGIRFDLIQKNDVDVAGVKTLSPGNLPRYSIMTEIRASEYSRVRLQYSHDRTCRDSGSENRVFYHQLALEYTMIVGLLPRPSN